MNVLRAAWVVPVDQPPIRDGWVAVDEGRIVGVGAWDVLSGNPEGLPPQRHAREGDSAKVKGLSLGDAVAVRDCGRVALLPGLVNTHTHIELSWLRDRVPPAGQFTSWIKHLVATRGGAIEHPDDPRVLDAADAALREARECGTVAIGDISNSLASVGPLVRSGLHALVFHELIGFKETTGALVERTRPERARAAERHPRVRVSVAPHAPYSVSPELFRAIRAEVSAGAVPVTSVHVAESVEEMELLADGTGEWARMLKWIGAWRADWEPPGSGPVEYLDGLGVIDARTLVVHAVQLSDDSLARVRERGATIVTCPRSNQWVGVGVPPLERFYLADVPVAVGTDSLASVEDLNLFSELKVMRWLAPGVPARRLLESATLVGARALGLDHELGSLTPGKRAEVLAIDLPPDVTDIEEHLLTGISPGAIEWVTGD